MTRSTPKTPARGGRGETLSLDDLVRLVNTSAYGVRIKAAGGGTLLSRTAARAMVKRGMPAGKGGRLNLRDVIAWLVHELLTPREDYRNATAELVAAVLGVSRQAVHKWRRDGAPCKQGAGREVKFDVAEVVQWKVDRAAAQARAVPRAKRARSEDDDAREAVLSQVRAILEQGDSDVARMQAAKLLLGEAERDRLEEESRDAVIAFVEIANDGEDRIVSRGPLRLNCPSCGELIEAE